MAIQDRFPDLFPMEKIRVTGEEHEYEVIEYDDESTIEKSQYVPDKSPVLIVEDVTGVVDGDEYTFEQGVDYEVIDTDNDSRLDTIEFDVGGVSPDHNSVFTVTYVCNSIIQRYVGSYDDELSEVAEDIDEAISSHYVDEATDTGAIDTFEDDELVEYNISNGSVSNVLTQSSTVLSGQFALELRPSPSTNITITSESGLNTYPERGDTITYYTHLTDADDISRFDFLYHTTDAGGERFYRICVDSSNGSFTIQKNSGSQKIDTLSVPIDSYLNEWLRVEVDIEPIGVITATIFDSEENEIGFVSITDSEYTTGGIRWNAINDTTQSSVFFDTAEVIQRESSDLDYVGAIFGDLGLRRGRNDVEYNTYLRSIVQSFRGRGTVEGIKFAVASAFDFPPDQIIIEEDFTDNEYIIAIETPFPPHETATVSELAALADPSGVNFANISYTFERESVSVDDNVTVSEGITLSDGVSINDSVNLAQPTVVTESVSIDDSVTSSTTDVYWGENWDEINWAVEHN